MRVIKTKYGKVQGKMVDQCERYLGIPYAKPPVGDRRFLPPEEPDAWEDVKQCDTWPKSALQIPYDAEVQSEDCLALNIWIPPVEKKSKLPVMVWIHGGSYATGSTTNVKQDGDGELYDAKTLARDTGCILITLNYRLNVVGFLDLSEINPKFTRNNGLRDIVAALQWIHDNIGEFGGDINNVTVFGQSAGGGLTLALLCVPQAQSLFHKLICQSSGDSGFHTIEKGVELAHDWLDAMGNPSEEELLHFDGEELISSNKQMDEKVLSKRIDCTFCPIVDGEYLTEFPSRADLSQSGKKLMIGWNHDEASVFMLAVKKDLFMEPDSLPIILPDQSDETRRRIITETPEFPNKKSYTQLANERMYSIPITYLANHMSKHNDVFVYRLDYAPRLLRWMGIGACHSVELPLLFRNPIMLGKLSATVLDSRNANRVGKRLRHYWGEFARNGRPHHQWVPYDPKNQSVMIIAKRKDRIALQPMKTRMKLYDAE